MHAHVANMKMMGEDSASEEKNDKYKILRVYKLYENSFILFIKIIRCNYIKYM